VLPSAFRMTTVGQAERFPGPAPWPKPAIGICL
jgi:hypothetical protein